MESIENSQIYKEHLDIIQNSDRINVFKNNTDQSYFSVAYIQKDSDGKIVKTLIFDVNEEYKDFVVIENNLIKVNENAPEGLCK